ncbi:MAG: hypothetical protein R3C03_08020 [Pirellulaceae bacterium]
MSSEHRIRIVNSTNITLSILALLLAGGMFLVFAYASGETIGREFSPDDFSIRSFNFNRSTWIPITFRGIQHSTTQKSWAAKMFSDGIIPRVNGQSQQWDLVEDNKMPRFSTAYDAAILVNYLEMKSDGGSEYWEDWNKAHPSRAQILWPKIAKLARSGNYFATPLLLDHALDYEGESDEKFASEQELIWADLVRDFELDLHETI